MTNFYYFKSKKGFAHVQHNINPEAECLLPNSTRLMYNNSIYFFFSAQGPQGYTVATSKKEAKKNLDKFFNSLYTKV